MHGMVTAAVVALAITAVAALTGPGLEAGAPRWVGPTASGAALVVGLVLADRWTRARRAVGHVASARRVVTPVELRWRADGFGAIVSRPGGEDLGSVDLPAYARHVLPDGSRAELVGPARPGAVVALVVAGATLVPRRPLLPALRLPYRRRIPAAVAASPHATRALDLGLAARNQ